MLDLYQSGSSNLLNKVRFTILYIHNIPAWGCGLKLLKYSILSDLNNFITSWHV